MPSFRRTLFVEWTGVAWLDLIPRLRAGQLPQLARVGKQGGYHSLPVAADAWPLPGATAQAFGWSSADPVDRIDAADLDPVLLKLFPDSAAVRGLLLDALAALYTSHDAAVAATTAVSSAAPLAVRLPLIAHLATIYAASPALPEALAAGYRLLDTLLGDLHRHLPAGSTVIVASPAAAARDGFVLLPPPANPAAVPPAIDRLTALADPSAPPRPRPPLWQQPRFVPIGPLARPLAADEFEQPSLRRGAPADRPRLAARFPSVTWPTAAAGSLVVLGTSGEATLLAAAAWTAAGALTLAAVPGFATHPFAARLLADTIAAARAAGITALFNVNPLPPADPLLAPLRTAGFLVTDEIALWHLRVATDLTRPQLLAPRPRGRFELRPAHGDDVEFWRRRPETARLLPAQPDYDRDLSWATALDGTPAGLLLGRRADHRVVIELLVVDPAARATAATFALLAQLGRSMRAAGLGDLIFSIDATRDEAARLARRCGARPGAAGGLRLRCDLTEGEPLAIG